MDPDFPMVALLGGRKQYLQQLVDAGSVDLFLTPPVQQFQLLGFDAYEKLYQVGYEYTRKQLAEWDGLERVPRTSSPVRART